MQEIVRRIRFASETRALASMRAFVVATALSGAVPDGEARRLALAADEAVTNVIEHGYRGRADGRIEVEVRVREKRAEVVIRDGGEYFDVAHAPRRPLAPDPTEPLRVRGLGLKLIHGLMDEVHYRLAADRQNELRLVRFTEGGKRIPGAA